MTICRYCGVSFDVYTNVEGRSDNVQIGDLMPQACTRALRPVPCVPESQLSGLGGTPRGQPTTRKRRV